MNKPKQTEVIPWKAWLTDQAEKHGLTFHQAHHAVRDGKIPMPKLQEPVRRHKFVLIEKQAASKI